MKERLTKREQQAIETRKRIYDSAKSLFTKHGYSAVSIDDIVKEAGVARGSFYVYFMSKEDLSVYLMLDGLEGMQSQLNDYWANLDKSLPASHLIIQTACGISATVQSMSVETVRTVYKIFIERSATTGGAVKELFDMPFLFTELYNFGVQRGEFIKTDAITFAEGIKIILIGLTFEWCLYHPDYDFIGKTKTAISNYLRGFIMPANPN